MQPQAMSPHENQSRDGCLTPVFAESRHAETQPAARDLPMQLLTALMDRPAEEPESIDFAAFGRALRRFWLVPCITVAVCLSAAVYWLQHTPKLYVALAQIAVGQERTELMPSVAKRGEDLKSLEVLKSIEGQIAGQNVLIEVAHRFKLHHDPVLAGPRAAAGLNDDEVVMALSRRVTANLEKGTRLIVISVEDTDPKRARDICQAIVDLVVLRDPGASSALKEKAVVALEKQVSEARSRMDTTQLAVNSFRSRYPNLPLEESPSEMKTNTFEDRLKALSGEVLKAEEEVSAMTGIVQRIDAAGNNINALLAVPGLGTQESAVSQRRALSEAQAKFAEIDYGPRHPVYRTMQQQIAELTNGLLEVLISGATVERARYEKAKRNLDRITSEITALKEQQIQFAGTAGEFQKLARELKASREAYSAVLGRLNEEKTNSGYGESALTVIADPLVPSNPSKPKRLLVAAAGGVAGLISGVGLIALLVLTDRSIRSIAGGERVLRLPGLAALPRVKTAAGEIPLVYGKEKDSPSAEAFRGLRAALGMIGRARAARSFLFTSARAGEGKSYVAVNFAASLAHQGYRTLIIDANLRAPVMDSVFLGRRSASGLADYLSGECGANAKLCQQTDVPNLFLFSAGIPRAHPGEILNELAFARLLEESLKWFHRVVIDTPSAGQYADALPLAGHVDAVCLVVRPGMAKKGWALKTVARLATSGGRPAGFVLNAATDDAVKEEFAGDFAPSLRSSALLPALPATRA